MKIDFSMMKSAEMVAEQALAQAKEDALNAVLEQTQAQIEIVPLWEMLSFEAKERSAVAVLAGETGASAQLVEIEAGITGETPQALAQDILTKATAYHVHIAQLSGLKRKMEREITAAKTIQDVADIRASNPNF